MKTNEKQRNGISLIVLVITIVVIIILAAAVILSLNNNNPITNAKKASFQSDVRTFEDELNLYIADQYARNMGMLDLNTINAQDGSMNTYISSMKPKYHAILEVKNGKLVVKSTATGDEKIWAEEILGGTTTGSGGAVTPGEPVDSNKTFDGKPANATNPIIPKGFAPINEGEATWGTSDGASEGLVIEDMTDDLETAGNQFVWIPVPEFSNFKRQNWESWSATGEPANMGTDYKEESGDGIATNTEAEKMYKSVKDNQGFYIARYEAGKPAGTLAIDGSVKPLSQANKPVWNGIRLDYASIINPGDGAAKVARAMYPSTSEEVGVTSTLIYSVQWDAAMRWMKDIKNTEDASKLYITNSAGMGNHSGKVKQTGTTPTALVNNIYDLAGNVYEWTMERTTPSYACRGGYHLYASPVSTRANGYSSSNPNLDVGFRAALYIKLD